MGTRGVLRTDCVALDATALHLGPAKENHFRMYCKMHGYVTRSPRSDVSADDRTGPRHALNSTNRMKRTDEHACLDYVRNTLSSHVLRLC